MRILVFVFLFSGSLSEAAQITENFTSNARKDSSQTTAVWNIYSNRIHPPLAVAYNSATNNDDQSVDVGDGSDGVFNNTTYANFSVNGDTTGSFITVDTDAHPVLNVTSFTLDAGWTLLGQGSLPLWIKSQGPVSIVGTIDCSGGIGGPITNDPSASATGGTARCGGGGGGRGAATGLSAITGTAGGTSITGGGGGANSAGAGLCAGGGGGGGTYRDNTADGANGGGVGGGSKGTNFQDNHFLKFGTSVGGPGAGSGGGGGGAYLTLDGNIGRGGGGGAGGGAVRISAIGNVSLSAAGKILATGGDGGGGATGSGGGGGGGGGSVWIQTVGLYQNAGTIDARNGAKGDNTSGLNCDGGAGGNGRTWLINLDGTVVPIVEQPPTALIDTGSIHYSLSPYVAQSIGIDMLSTNPTYTLASFISSLPGTSTATLTVAGSRDNFQSDNTGFVSTANLSALKGKRFLKFRVDLQLQTASVPATTAAYVSQVAVSSDSSKLDDFQFQSACGSVRSGDSSSATMLSLFLIPLLLIFRLRRRTLPLSRS